MRDLSLLMKGGKSAALALGLGMVATLLAGWQVERSNRQAAELAVAEAAEQMAATVAHRVRLYQYGLRGVRGLVAAVGEQQINRELFHRYSLTRDVDAEFPGARGFGFIRRVAESDLEIFLARARADGKSDFAIRQLSPHNGERYVIQYIEPVDRNAPAIGLDIASETNRRRAATESLRSGEIRLTGPITLVQASGSPSQSFLILMPIYRTLTVPATEKQRLAEGYGWSYAPLLMKEVLADIPLERNSIRLQLYDVTDPHQPELFFSNNSSSHGPELFTQRQEQEVFGRRWQLIFSVQRPFIDRLHLPSPPGVIFIGTMFSLLAATLAGALSIGRQRRRQIGAEQAQLAAIVESSSDGIIGQTLDGVITSWNHGAEQLFGYTAAQAIGQPLAELIVPDERSHEEHEIQDRIRRGERIPNLETRRRRQDGQLVDVAITISPVFASDGRLSGASKTVHDIASQKANEAKIKALNASLEAQVQQRTTELRKTNLLLSSVLQSASAVSIIATDSDGIIQVFNRGAELLLGYSADEIVGHCTPLHFHVAEELEERAKELSQEYHQPVSGFQVLAHKPGREGPETREWTYQRKDGSRFAVTLVATAIRDEQGTLSGYLGIALDISQQQRQRQQLVAARDQLMLAAEVAELGIWTWTPDDNRLWWNDRMFELYDQPRYLNDNGLNYVHWSERIHPDDVAATVANLNAAVAIGIPYDPIFRIVRPDGTIRYIQGGAQIERDANGRAVKVTGINRDVTRQRELESHLRHAKEQADAASAAKSAFLANMSHEIRTPMNAVLGMLALAMRTELTGRQRDYLSKAQSAASALLGLLNDILDYSKIEAGKLQLDPHPFALETLMRELAVVLAANQGQKPVELLYDIDPELPPMVVGDRLRLQQILINLAGNALKFTASGEVVVSLSALGYQHQKLKLQISISDTGIGISADQQQRIFEGFTQAEASTSRRYGGTGLGLVICKRLVELMGSELSVSSRLGEGSRFWFELWLPLATDPAPIAQPPHRDLPLRVLIIDDNPTSISLLQRAATHQGWHYELASSGKTGVALAIAARKRGEPFDVALIDAQLLDVDGLAVAEQIRQAASPAAAPAIILLSAYHNDQLTALEHSPTSFVAALLTKPFTLQQLISAIDQACSGRASEPTPAASLARQRLTGLRLLVVEDNLLNRQVAEELLSNEGAEVTLAEGGLAGVELALTTIPSFDAVLMDVQMPDIDGLEATRRIRAEQRLAALPIIAMTANASASDREACLGAGMDEHIGKPFELDTLVDALRRLTGQDRSLPPALTMAAATTAPEVEVEELAQVLARLGGNIDIYRKLLPMFVPQAETQLAALSQHLSQQNLSGAQACLHTLKGIANTLGAKALASRSAELELRLKADDGAVLFATLGNHTVAELQQLLERNHQQLAKALAEIG